MATTDHTSGVTLSDADWADDVDCSAYSVLSSPAGTNTITATGPATYTYAATRPPVWFIPAATNTAATTINITPSGGSALGAKNIFLNGVALVGGELRAGVPTGIVYDGTQFNIIGAGALNQMPWDGGGNILNGYVAWSVDSNTMTAAIKTSAGSDPSAANPVTIAFRNVTATTGSLTTISLTAATSITINNTATLGTIDSVAFRIWAVAFNDGGTVRLGVINCVTTTANSGSGRDVSAVFGLRPWGIASSTQEGDGSDSASVFYTDSAAVSSKAYAVLGYATWESGLSSAGVWDSAPTRQELYALGVPLPGQAVQRAGTIDGEVATGTTQHVLDDTIPQSSEGDQYMSQAITPHSTANVIKVEHKGVYASSAGGGGTMIVALFKDSVANALGSVYQYWPGANQTKLAALDVMLLAGTTSAVTYKIRSGLSAAGTTTFNGHGGARYFAGVMASTLYVTEIMG